jgi:IS5 family transposase
VTRPHALVCVQESDVFADADCQGGAEPVETWALKVNCSVAMRPGKRRGLDRTNGLGRIIEAQEQGKIT